MRQDQFPKARLDDLAGAVREGTLSEKQAAELRELLAVHPGARRRFVEHVFLTLALEAECTESFPSSRAERKVVWNWWLSRINAVLAAAVVLMVLQAGWSYVLLLRLQGAAGLVAEIVRLTLS